ncbi:MAG: heparinase II/III family protein [Caldilineaceae bacterium]|nr:heparinase II/III family protein [Caldilineaceae bacterium]
MHELTRYNVIDIEHSLRETAPTPPFPPLADRAAWAAVGARLGQAQVAAILAQAETDAQTPIPALPATLFLDFARTGERTSYEDRQGLRRRMLWSLTLAECLENRGRFLDPLLDVAWATCEESSWVYPAHEATLADMAYPYLDLGVAGTALNLAEMDALIGAQLDPRLGKRIRDEVARRCLTPYLTRHDHWWLHQSQTRNVNNWTAVCNSGIVGAALYLEPDPARLAEIIARALRSLDDYLATFDPDGGSSEGPGYWGYGFGYYVILAHLLAQRTNGAIQLLAGERLRQIGAYPLRTLLSRGIYVNFSDCDPAVALEPALLHYLGEQLALPDLHGLAATQQATASQCAYFDWGLRSLFWLPPTPAPTTYAPARHDWFSGMQWMLARLNPTDPDALVLAAKGGHNDEMHNQNDVGNLIVHWRRESLVADVGVGRYTKAYFGDERYDHFVNSSLGHSVPVVNGQLQGAGPAYAAHLLDHQANDQVDHLWLDLTKVYPPAAGLAALQRRVTLHRTAPHGWISLEDHFAFPREAAPFESALTTFYPVEIGETAVLINGIHGKLRIGFAAEAVEVRLERHVDIDFAHGPQDVLRIVFRLQTPAQQGCIALELVPVA